MSTTQYPTDLKCQSCVNKIGPVLDQDEGIDSWSVALDSPEKTLTVEGSDIGKDHVNQLLESVGFHIKSEPELTQLNHAGQHMPEKQPFKWETYRPLLILVGYLLGTTLLAEAALGSFEPMRVMRHFMAAFFLAFSFFKMFDLVGFANSFQSYDILAKRNRNYAFVYPFIELLLGIGFMLNVLPIVTNTLAFIVMGIGLIGVVQAVFAKHRIQCACLGNVFDLPMSTVTIIENSSMMVMAGYMLFKLLG